MPDGFLSVELDDSEGNLGALLPVGSDIYQINLRLRRYEIVGPAAGNNTTVGFSIFLRNNHLKEGAGKAWAGHKRLIEMPDAFLRVKLDDSEWNLGALLPVGSNR